MIIRKAEKGEGEGDIVKPYLCNAERTRPKRSCRSLFLAFLAIKTGPQTRKTMLASWLALPFVNVSKNYYSKQYIKYINNDTQSHIAYYSDIFTCPKIAASPVPLSLNLNHKSPCSLL